MSARDASSTSNSLIFRLTDSITGAGKSGLTVTTLSLQYVRPGAAPSTATALTLLGSTTTAFTPYGAIEEDAAHSTGLYRVDCPDAAFAAGASEVALTITGAGVEPATRLIDIRGLIDGQTQTKAQEIIAAAVAGNLSGAGTGTETVVGLDGATSRAVATIDDQGNRTVSYPMTIKAGELRHVVAIQRAVWTPNASGEEVPAWSTLQVLRALVTSEGGSETVIGGAPTALSLYKVKHRYYAGLTTKDRYVWQGLILEISNLQPDPRKIEQVVSCVQAETYAGRNLWFGSGWWSGHWYRNGWWRAVA